MVGVSSDQLINISYTRTIIFSTVPQVNTAEA